LSELDAGCRAPVAVYARVAEGKLYCRAFVSDPKGTQVVRVDAENNIQESDEVVRVIVQTLRDRNADEIIAACRG